MDSYTSMKTKLTQTGLYDVLVGTLTHNELKAYALELDKLRKELEEMTREYYIVTAQSYGLSEREKFLGKVRNEYDINKRRQLLIFEERPLETAASIVDFINFLKGCGIDDFYIDQRYNNTMSITIYDTVSPVRQKELNQRILAELPPHYIVKIIYP